MTTREAVRIVLADDHLVVRTGLAALLASESGIQVVGEASNGIEALEACRRLAPDILVADFSMPGLAGPDLVKEVIRCSPHTRVIVLTVHKGDAAITRSLQAGAMAYLTKTCTRDEILAAIQSVRSGRRYVPSELAEVLADALSSPALTPREQQVLEKIAEGRSNKQIAAELGLGTRTVKEHLTSIFRKLGVQDRTDALGVAIRRGLVRLS